MKKVLFSSVAMMAVAGWSVAAFSNESEPAPKASEKVGSIAPSTTKPVAPEATQAAGLDWINSFEDAKAMAKATGRPILLLSMFGDIDEELPCANARTMRAALFPTPAFQQLAKNDVVLAWEKVRDVPRVTIEIDGRKIERTVRGNAVMYLCNEDGKVVDVYPGQYAEEEFMPAIRESLKKYVLSSDEAVIKAHSGAGAELGAEASKRMTTSKMAVESPVLALFTDAKPTLTIGTERKVNPVSHKEKLRARYEQLAAMCEDMSLTPLYPRGVLRRTIGIQDSTLTPAEKGEKIRRLDSANNIRYVRPLMHLYLASRDKLPTPMEAREDILEKLLKIPYKDPNWGLGDLEMPGTPAAN